LLSTISLAARDKYPVWRRKDKKAWEVGYFISSQEIYFIGQNFASPLSKN